MKTLILFVGAIGLAQAQKTFDTPAAAAQALIDAASKNDTAQLAQIFGPQGNTLLTSGNPQQDKAEREEFSNIARGRHMLQKDSMNSDRMILSIGAEDWPFPVPIVRTNGKWSFDTSMGEMSMKARRIGANELDVIEICAGYAGRQDEYAKQHRMRYAETVKALGNQVPKEFVEAAGPHPKPYHGYYFTVLKAQGAPTGFALVAWPSEYGVSGVHTFIVSRDGVVFEKDLGGQPNPSTSPVTRFDPDNSWKPVN